MQVRIYSLQSIFSLLHLCYQIKILPIYEFMVQIRCEIGYFKKQLQIF